MSETQEELLKKAAKIRSAAARKDADMFYAGARNCRRINSQHASNLMLLATECGDQAEAAMFRDAALDWHWKSDDRARELEQLAIECGQEVLDLEGSIDVKRRLLGLN